MISLGCEDFDFALRAAALGGNFEIAKDMISKGFNLFKKTKKKKMKRKAKRRNCCG